MPRYKLVNSIFLVVISILMLVDWQRDVDWKIYAAIFFVFVAIQVYGTLYMSSNFFMPAICSGGEEAKGIALTFDDGPVSGKTERVLEVLKAHQVEACFFCIGQHIEKHPALVQQIHDEGHILGNHSFHHGWNFDLLSSGKMKGELKRTDEAIGSILQLNPRFFRPPYGVTNPGLAVAVGTDYKTIGWTVRSFDTVIKNPARLLKRVNRKLRAGDIVLFHDHSDAMLQILPDFIKHVQSLGLKIVRVDQLIGESPYTTNT